MCLCTQKASHASFLVSKQRHLLTFDPSGGAKRSTEITAKSPPSVAGTGNAAQG